MEIQNISLQNTESLQTHQGGRNNFSRQQQNFGNQLDLSYIGCGDVRRNQNTENEAINRVPNGYHRGEFHSFFGFLNNLGSKVLSVLIILFLMYCWYR